MKTLKTHGTQSCLVVWIMADDKLYLHGFVEVMDSYGMYCTERSYRAFLVFNPDSLSIAVESRFGVSEEKTLAARRIQSVTGKVILEMVPAEASVSISGLFSAKQEATLHQWFRALDNADIVRFFEDGIVDDKEWVVVYVKNLSPTEPGKVGLVMVSSGSCA